MEADERRRYRGGREGRGAWLLPGAARHIEVRCAAAAYIMPSRDGVRRLGIAQEHRADRDRQIEARGKNLARRRFVRGWLDSPGTAGIAATRGCDAKRMQASVDMTSRWESAQACRRACDLEPVRQREEQVAKRCILCVPDSASSAGTTAVRRRHAPNECPSQVRPSKPAAAPAPRPAGSECTVAAGPGQSRRGKARSARARIEAPRRGDDSLPADSSRKYRAGEAAPWLRRLGKRGRIRQKGERHSPGARRSIRCSSGARQKPSAPSRSFQR